METEPQIIDSYIKTGKARLIYRHLLQLGEPTVRASEASECAGDQDKFWEMRDLLYRSQSDLYNASDLDATLAGLAGQLGLNQEQFTNCMSARTHLEQVQADYRAAQSEGIRSRPSFIINGRRLVGALPFEQFQQLIDQ
ncbi:MAG: hypothetical protein OHK0022_23520 [Roseiflexaceae bacterium]